MKTVAPSVISIGDIDNEVVMWQHHSGGIPFAVRPYPPLSLPR
jgi:hypothetical protein